VASFRAEMQQHSPSSHVRQLARRHQVNSSVERPADDQWRRLTPPVSATDLRHVPDLYTASTAADAVLEVCGRRLRSVGGQGDLRAAALEEHDEADPWLARTNQTTSSEDDQTSKGDTEDELSK